MCITFYFMYTFCTQICIFGQNLAIFIKFLIFQNLARPYKISCFPQHCLYFLPEPHELNIPILSVLSVFIVLSVFYCILVSGIICIYCIYSTICIYCIPVSGIICIYCIYSIICTYCIYLLWTNCGHCHHSFT